MRLILYVFLALQLTIPVHAIQSCDEDAKKFCPKVKEGQRREFKCLQKNLEKLSATCKTEVETLLSKQKNALEVCASDIEKLCKDVPEKGGKVGKCLFKNKEKLSAKCLPYFSGSEPK